MALKSDYIVYFSLPSSFFGSKSFLHLVLLLTSGGLSYRLRTGRMRVTAILMWHVCNWRCCGWFCLWRSECLVFNLACLIGMSRSGSVALSLKFLLFLVEVLHLGCLLGGINTVLLTGLSPNLVILAHLLGWTLLSGTVSETKT